MLRFVNIHKYELPEISMDVFDVNGGLVGSSAQVKAIDSTFALSSARNKKFQVHIAVCGINLWASYNLKF